MAGVKNVLITGVAGFIGSNFAYLVAEKHPEWNVVGVDHLSGFSTRTSIAPLETSGALKFYQADIADSNAMGQLYDRYQFHYVINFAAESHNDRAILDPEPFVRSNVLGAQVLAELSRRHETEHHIHVSTIEVYGEQGPEVTAFTEASPLNAKTPYSAAKAGGDLMLRSYMLTYPQFRVSITHCANNYGPYQFPEKLIPLAISRVLRGEKIPLYGDGLQRRDWLHVRDHCLGILTLLTSERGRAPEPNDALHPERLPIYDFSAREERTNIEIARIIAEELGYDFNDVVTFVSDRPNHDRRYLIDPSKVERELGFAPSISFETGMRETVRWYVQNRAWWEAIVNEKELAIDWGKQ